MPELPRDLNPAWILDSGAFTVWKQGGAIDVPAYLKFWREHQHLFPYLVAVDTIPGTPTTRPGPADVEKAARQSASEWERMRDAVPEFAERLIPVYHQGETINHLEYYVERGAKYIGLSPVSVAGESRAHQHQWMRHLVRLLPPDVKTHAFGAVSLNQEAAFLYSRDSTSWSRLTGYGSLLAPSGDRWHSVHVTHNYRTQGVSTARSILTAVRQKGIPVPEQMTAESLVDTYGARALLVALVTTYAQPAPRTYAALCLNSLIPAMRRWLPNYLLASFALLRDKKQRPTDLYQALTVPLPDDDALWQALLTTQGIGNDSPTATRRTRATKRLPGILGAF